MMPAHPSASPGGSLAPARCIASAPSCTRKGVPRVALVRAEGRERVDRVAHELSVNIRQGSPDTRSVRCIAPDDAIGQHVDHRAIAS